MTPTNDSKRLESEETVREAIENRSPSTTEVLSDPHWFKTCGTKTKKLPLESGYTWLVFAVALFTTSGNQSGALYQGLVQIS